MGQTGLVKRMNFVSVRRRLPVVAGHTDAMERAEAVGVYRKSMALEELYPAIKPF